MQEEITNIIEELYELYSQVAEKGRLERKDIEEFEKKFEIIREKLRLLKEEIPK